MRQVDHVYVHALKRAAEMAGSVDALAEKLAISRLLVRAWVNGTQVVPASIFLRIVDLLNDQGLAPRLSDQGQTPE
jgi:DNA-binding transcriptional regulator YdaS (Cro superfamily)